MNLKDQLFVLLRHIKRIVVFSFLTRERVYTFLLNLMIFNFCFFLIFCPYGKGIVKICYYVGMGLFFLILFLMRAASFLRKPRVDLFFAIPSICFLASALVSVLLSDYTRVGRTIFVERYIPYFLMFIMGFFLSGYAPRHEIRLGKFRFFAVDLIAGAFILSAVVFSVGANIDAIRFHPERLYTVFNHRIDFLMFPIYLVFFIPVSFSLAFFSKKGFLKNFATIAFFLLIPCLILSGSRADWIAIPIGIAIIVSRKNSKLLKYVLFFVFLFLSSLFVFEPSRMRQFNTYFDRKDLWDSGIKILVQNPVFGAGLGAYEKSMSFYSKGYKALHAHNMYLEVLSEMGIVGLLAFLNIFVSFFRKTFSVVKTGFDSLRIGLEGMVIATLFFAFFNSVMLVGFRDAPLFWFLFGLGSGIIKSEST